MTSLHAVRNTEVGMIFTATSAQGGWNVRREHKPRRAVIHVARKTSECIHIANATPTHPTPSVGWRTFSCLEVLSDTYYTMRP